MPSMETKDTGNRLIMPKYDVAFKSIFKGDDGQEVAEGFLKAVLDIPKDLPFEEVTVMESELLPDTEGEKISILDVLLRIPGRGTFNVEMQLYKLPELKERLTYYLTKTASRQLSRGDSYAKLGKTVMIVIADFNFIEDSEHYHNRYFLYDKEHGSQFTDLLECDILELRKLPAESDCTEKWKWAKFFRSGSDAELREAAKESKEITKAMLRIERLSAEESAWMKAEYEEKQRRDYISRIDGAKREGRAEGLAEGEAKGRAEGEAKGRAEGEARGLAKGRAEGRAEIARRMAALGKSEAEIAEILGSAEKG